MNISNYTDGLMGMTTPLLIWCDWRLYVWCTLLPSQKNNTFNTTKYTICLAVVTFETCVKNINPLFLENLDWQLPIFRFDNKEKGSDFNVDRSSRKLVPISPHFLSFLIFILTSKRFLIDVRLQIRNCLFSDFVPVFLSEPHSYMKFSLKMLPWVMRHAFSATVNCFLIYQFHATVKLKSQDP